MLIVIAIIAILATIIILNVLSARAKANGAKVLSEMNAAAKVASICLSEDGLLYCDNTPNEFLTTGNCPLQPQANICSKPATAPGVWPAIAGIKGVVATYTQAKGMYNSDKTSFNITAPVGDEIIGSLSCDEKGCRK